MILGFAAAATGDWFMAGPGRSFTWGVVAFSVAQLFWMAVHAREGRPDLRLALVVSLPLAALFLWRIVPVVSGLRLELMLEYSVLSVAALAVASGTRRPWYFAGITLLFVSDVCIALRMAHAPCWAYGIGPLYIAALVTLIVSTVLDGREKRLPKLIRWPKGVVAASGCVILAFFLLAIAAAPEYYNPCLSMLSRLGRTQLAGVDYPLCHYLFTFGMLVSAVTIGCSLTGWGGWLVAAGLVTIAAVPENVNMVGHNAGCYLATLGGTIAVLSRRKTRFGRVSAIVLLSVVAAFGLSLLLQAQKVISFAPTIPTLQKLLIVSFALWVVVVSSMTSRFRRPSAEGLSHPGTTRASGPL